MKRLLEPISHNQGGRLTHCPGHEVPINELAVRNAAGCSFGNSSLTTGAIAAD